ncbi:MAG: CHASE2 domain-containing protein [Synechococcaceae cyanobacterium RL_1_2]|nr:CHASE2 domain-containing protein [Synechococcaceae cyanobacterium RL_1_2]
MLQYELQKDNVISIQYLGSEDNQIAAPLGASQQQIGFNDVVLDWDSKLRRNLMYARLGEEELYSFALRLSLAYLRKNPDVTGDFKLRTSNDSLYLDDVRLPRLQANSGGYRLPPSEALGWQILLQYQSPKIA